LASETHERAQKRFESRVGTIIELLDAQERLTRAQINLSQARADYQTALANLLYAMGERNAGLRF
jgi:outer membrane protein TolC